MTYEEFVIHVENGKRFNIDFENNKSTLNGKEVVIEEFENDFECKGLRDVLIVMKELFDEYESSVPTERNNRKRKRYFSCKSLDELTDSEMVCGERRDSAQAKLEAFVLLMTNNGSLYWDDEVMNGKWFYMDGNMVLLKKWINR